MLAFAAFLDGGDFLCIKGDSGLGLLEMELRPVVGHASVCVALRGICVCLAGLCSSRVAAMCVVAGGGGERSPDTVALSKARDDGGVFQRVPSLLSTNEVPKLFEPLL